MSVVSHFRHRVCYRKFKRHCGEKQRDDGIHTVEEVGVILVHLEWDIGGTSTGEGMGTDGYVSTGRETMRISGAW